MKNHVHTDTFRHDLNLKSLVADLGGDADNVECFFAGQSVYVPKNIRPDSPLFLAFGMDTALQLARYAGGRTFPVGTPRIALVSRIVLWLSHAGFSVNVIAAIAGISARHVSRHRRLWRDARLLPVMRRT